MFRRKERSFAMYNILAWGMAQTFLCNISGYKNTLFQERVWVFHAKYRARCV
jgi:hypothetical protein